MPHLDAQSGTVITTFAELLARPNKLTVAVWGALEIKKVAEMALAPNRHKEA